MPATTPAPAQTSTRFADGGLQAVLWDMDGTIVDTEPYWIAAEKELVAAHGGVWTDEDAMSMVGNALDVSAAVLQESIIRQGGPVVEPRTIIDTLSSRVIEQVRTAVPWRPGARELLEDLNSAGVPCALVTMSEGPLASTILSALPEGTMEFKITGDMVSRGKPDPEPYLAGLERLRGLVPDLDPARVVALEDSIPGVASAAASGATTIAVPHVVPLPAPRNWTVWETLQGRTAADLDAHVRALVSGATVASGAAADGPGE
ncbi:HAD family phosphatase [Zhihengliuella sp.]|uniref:HAD family hydrolase n=1 Tax=Zhihengliuella sp. TaxID=1954483 RepID=UPI002810F5BD|nr:HAD family phosphatase [Zhihengliuella sp.]